MHKVKKFSANDRSVSHFCLGKKIKSFKYGFKEKKPLEVSVKITLEDGTEILTYTLMRIIKNNGFVFSNGDYYLDNRKLTTIKNVEKQLRGSRIERVKFNKTGDCTLFLDSGEEIQIIVDLSKAETVYFRIDKAMEYYILCRIENDENLTVKENVNQ